MKKVLDVRTLECPKPILETQKALKEEGLTELEVIVGNKTSRENLKRFSESGGYKYELIDEGEDVYRFVLKIASSKPEVAKDKVPESQEEGSLDLVEGAEMPLPKTVQGKTYLILSDELGKGESELGKVLMKGFLYTIGQAEPFPEKILLLNAAVRLSTQNEEAVEHLKFLEQKGTQVYSCGTCLNFYGLADNLKVGLIGNMYDVVDSLNKTGNVTTIG